MSNIFVVVKDCKRARSQHSIASLVRDFSVLQRMRVVILPALVVTAVSMVGKEEERFQSV